MTNFDTEPSNSKQINRFEKKKQKKKEKQLKKKEQKNIEYSFTKYFKQHEESRRLPEINNKYK